MKSNTLEVVSTKSHIIERLEKYLKIINLSKYDYIVPIPHKGIKILFLTTIDEEIKNKIISPKSIELNNISLENKWVLLFDDAIYEGNTLWSYLKTYENKCSNVDTAAFLVSNKYVPFDEQDYLDFKGIKTKSVKEYRSWRNKILQKLLISSNPLFIDSLIFTFKSNIENIEQLSNLYESLKQYGNVYFIHHTESKNLYYFTLDSPKFKPLNQISNIQCDVVNEGVSKIRFICNLEEKKIFIIPIWHPAAIILKEKSKKELNTSYFNIFRTKNLKYKYEFITIIYSYALFIAFLNSFNDKKVFLSKFVDMNMTFLKIMFGDFSVALFENINNEITSYYNNNEKKRPIITFKDNKIIKNELLEFKEKSKSDFEFKIYDSCSKYENMMINLAKLLKTDEIITFTQMTRICKSQFKSLDISRNLNLALDISKLTTQISEKQVYIDSKLEKIMCTTYKWAGEFSRLEYEGFYDYYSR